MDDVFTSVHTEGNQAAAQPESAGKGGNTQQPATHGQEFYNVTTVTRGFQNRKWFNSLCSFLVQKIIAVLTEDNMHKDSDQTITWLCFSKESIVISTILVYIAVKKTSTCRLQYICHFKYLINLYVVSECQELDRLQHRWYDWLDVTCIYISMTPFIPITLFVQIWFHDVISLL